MEFHYKWCIIINGVSLKSLYNKNKNISDTMSFMVTNVIKKRSINFHISENDDFYIRLTIF